MNVLTEESKNSNFFFSYKILGFNCNLAYERVHFPHNLIWFKMELSIYRVRHSPGLRESLVLMRQREGRQAGETQREANPTVTPLGLRRRQGHAHYMERTADGLALTGEHTRNHSWVLPSFLRLPHHHLLPPILHCLSLTASKSFWSWQWDSGPGLE